MGVKVIRVDAEHRFLDALKGEVDPKRNADHRPCVFIEVFEEEAAKVQGREVACADTIYPERDRVGPRRARARRMSSSRTIMLGGAAGTHEAQVLEPLPRRAGSRMRCARSAR